MFHVLTPVSLFFSSFFSSLPEHIVVPSSLTDQELMQYASSFTDRRIPVSIYTPTERMFIGSLQ